VILRKLPEKRAAEILSEMDAEDSAEVVGAMRESRAIRILEGLAPDDAADLICKLDEEDRQRLLGRLSPTVADTIRELLSYSPDTAGGIMNPNVAVLRAELTVAQAIERIRVTHEEIENVNDFYVIDHNRRLCGVVTLRDLVFADPHNLVRSIMNTTLEGVCLPYEDKEAVALRMAEKNLSFMPVVSTGGHLLGLVTHDDVLDVIQQEATEDIQKLHGAGADESIHDDVWDSLRKRTPWLLVNLLTAFLVPLVVACFRTSIEKMSMLAVFMTITASIGGNTGAQTLAVAIRAIALGEIHISEGPSVCGRETLKGLLNGLLVGFIASLMIGFSTHDLRMAGTALFALIANMAFAGFAGAFIPIILTKLKLDPAQSSYIFLTAFTDVVGVLIFLGLGSLCFR
jgi:magnesium transporter